MRRLLGCSIAAVAMALCLAAPAAAAGKPEIIHVELVGVDEEASAGISEFCGFDVVVFAEVRETVRIYPDGSERVTSSQRFTYTAGDQQLFERNSFQVFFDPEQEIERYTGVPFGIMDESGRVIFKDRGNVAFDRDGNIVWEHGPHPSLHDTSDRTICDDLSE